MISDFCKSCVHCIKYGYLHYSMSKGKKILIDKCFKCEKTVDITLEIPECTHFEAKKKRKSGKDINKDNKQVTMDSPTHKIEPTTPRKQPKKKCKSCGKLHDRKDNHICPVLNSGM